MDEIRVFMLIFGSNHIPLRDCLQSMFFNLCLNYFQKLFSSCTSIPELGGTLHCKEFGKKSWNKKFLLLRGSGIYLSNKGKSKVR